MRKLNVRKLNVVEREIARQKEQGFLEEKAGLISPNFYFQILLADNKHDDYFTNPILKIVRGSVTGGGVIYRKTSGCKGYYKESDWLAKEPTEEFGPLHEMISSFIPIIGHDGKAQYDVLRPRTDQVSGYRWDHSVNQAVSLQEGLDKYRYGYFSYKSPAGHLIGFAPDEDSSKPTGRISLELKIGDFKNFDPSFAGKIAALTAILPYSSGKEEAVAR